MSYKRRMVCLAASRKKGAYCYAGKELDSGAWIRPVTTHGEHEVSTFEATNTAGHLTAVGDIVDIEYLKHDPYHFQQENHLIDATRRWSKVGQATYGQLRNMVDQADSLWSLGSSSWGYGNNRVAEAVADGYGHSLLLIQPQRLRISVGRKGGDYGDANKRLVKAHFKYKGSDYTLQVTDPSIENAMWAGPDRSEDINEALLCVSLWGAYLGYAYKLVATVIRPY